MLPSSVPTRLCEAPSADPPYLCFLRVLSAASATSPTCSPIDCIRRAAEVIALRSTLPRSMFFTDFGSVTLRSAFSGRRESFRLFRATPPAIPAIPANAAPPAISGVFAFEANSATFPPAFATPFRELVPSAELVRRLALGLLLVLELELADELEEPLLLLLRFLPLEPLEVLEEPFLLVDLLALERLRVDRLLEDRVVWAMVIASLIGLASLPATPFAAAVHLDLPAVQGFELLVL